MRLPLVRDAASSQLVEHGRERLVSRIELRAGQRAARRGSTTIVDATAARRERLERRSGEREAQRVAHGGRDVDDAGRRRRRAQDDVVVADRDEDDARAREERDATQPRVASRMTAVGTTAAAASRSARATRRSRIELRRAEDADREELVLDDAPARDAELFLVDGNNLAYRAFFALPEELQTTDGQPTNALLGFTNMLFKLLSDYRPRGVAVAWDTRPVHRKEIDAEYKAERRRCPTSCASSSRTSARSSRRSATRTSSSRAGRPTT